MAFNVFYSMVKEYAEELVNKNPGFVPAADAAISALLTSSHDIIAGVTSVSLYNGSVCTVPAEYMAAVAMNNIGQNKVLRMITISLTDFSVVTPNTSELEVIASFDPDNIKCEVFLSANESVLLATLIGDSVPAEGIESEQEDTSAADISGYETAAEELTETTSSDEFEDISSVTNNYSAETDYSESSDIQPIDDYTAEAEIQYASDDSEEIAADNASVSDTDVSALFGGFGDDDDDSINELNEDELQKMGFIMNSSPIHEPVSTMKSEPYSVAPPADFAKEVKIDENNPFLEGEKQSEEKEIVYFAEMNESENSDKPENQTSVSENVNSRAKQQEQPSMEELMKQAKKRKKIAKANFNFRKK